MSLISELRTGLSNNLATVSGLRVSSFIPDNPNPPIAVVAPQGISFDKSFHRGMNEYQFSVLVIVNRASERSAQSGLDAYVSSTGTSSIKLALESDKTLGGKAYDVRVTDVRNYGSTTIGEIEYLSAEFVILCYAD